MDIDLLSKMLGELVLDHDEVGLPGLGTFVAETVPASFSDRGYTINPPYRRLSFHPGRSEDQLLVSLYAETNHVDETLSRDVLTKFVSDMKEVLKTRKTVVFPGLGRLRATRENNFFFVCDEYLDIYPEGFGLEPVSLKTHEETPAQIEAAVSSLASIVTSAAPEENGEVAVPEEKEVAEAVELVPEESARSETEAVPEESARSETEAAPEEAARSETEAALEEAAPEEIEIEPVTEVPVEPETTAESSPAESGTEETPAEPAETADSPEAAAPPKRRHRAFRAFFRTLLVLILIAAVALAAFLILAKAAPDFIDSILYTPEELRILNY